MICGSALLPGAIDRRAALAVVAVVACTPGPTADTDADSDTDAATSGPTGPDLDALCKYGTSGDSGGADGPWMELERGGATLSDGSTLTIACGFQGLFMFEVKPRVGGFVPESDEVEIAVTLDVEGHNDDPAGHFWSRPAYRLFLGCVTEDNFNSVGDAAALRMILPDEITDPAALHGQPARLEVTLETPDGPAAAAVELVIEAVADDSWMGCGG